MRIAVTGHRPDKLGGYDENPCHVAVKDHMRNLIRHYLDTSGEMIEVISGMALGCDQWWAEIGVDEGALLLAYVPFPGFDSKWPSTSRAHLLALLASASEQIVVDPDPAYSAAKLQKRNERMVDDCDILVAYWTGAAGGTANCIKYARATYPDKPIFIYNPLAI